MTAGELLDLVGNTPIVEPPPIQIAMTDYNLLGMGCQMCKRSSDGVCSACARNPIIAWKCKKCARTIKSRANGKQRKMGLCQSCGY